MISHHQPSSERMTHEPEEPSLESVQEALRQARETILHLTTENNDLREEGKKSKDIIREQREIIGQLELFATKDPLTGMDNRDGLEEKMSYLFPSNKEESGKRDPEKQKKASVLILDIDGFKGINDTNGHAAGDHVLAKLTEHLRNTIRIKKGGKGDILCRWGGDEIVIVFWGADAQDVINKFYRKDDGQAGFGFETEFNGKKMSVTLSGGVTDLIPGETIEKAVERADHGGLYSAKEAGKNRIVMVPTPQEKRESLPQAEKK
jgi:diguanylate cyclase (GGDEF)-like protein